MVVPPDNATAFADALIYLADHPEERGTMGSNSAFLLKTFLLRSVADKFVEILELSEKNNIMYSSFKRFLDVLFGLIGLIFVFTIIVVGININKMFI